MASSSKILTVSYGTFSCTAEGFEDPLAVVKDTTHFFRGVVREDRFFGAEPPQFDPELAADLMQAQIRAETEDGSLTLRGPLAAGGASSAQALSAALAAGPTIQRAAPRMPEPAVAEAELADDDDGAEEAARQSALDAQMQAALAQAERRAAELAAEEAAEALAASAAARAAAEQAAPESRPLVLSDPAPLLLDMPVEMSAGDDSLEAEAAFFGDVSAGPETGHRSAGAESVAEKLSRIRAVVAGGAAPEAALRDEDEDEDEDTIASVSALLGTLAEKTAPAEAAPVAEPDAPEAELVVPEAAEAAPAPQPAAPRRVRVVQVKRSAFEAAAADPAPAPQSSLSPEDEAELARELAAVKAELRADMDGAWQEDDDADDWDMVDAPAPLRASAPAAVAAQPQPAPQPAPAASDWDEDEWEEDEWEDAPAATLPAAAAPAAVAPAAATAEEEDEVDLDQLAHDDVRKAVKMSSPARVMLTEQSVGDTDASRILDETNTQMQEPEGNRRRSAIAHLRAAVAATRADRLLGRRRDSEEDFEPYREDLANAVRPRRPQLSGSPTERPAEPLRPAPLKLVAEQRVEPEPVAAEAPARPRRVTLADLEADLPVDAAEPEGDFAAYADSVGARDLPELLEAAAAYLSFVEGRDQFSRPQLMTKVRQVEARESSREDRLRSFGQLLREGKIEKTHGGRFTVSERISFRPSRAAG
ncbi:MAG: hypothetical protein ACU0A5_02510 [Salipiger marinus]|uniref:hypothetical protein n=1 Tax=Salipiger marinus TaxID=555512 RepID=UPI00405821C4